MSVIPEVMRGVQLTGHGGLDKLVLRTDIPVPVPGPCDVLIAVGAAGVNNTDLNTRIGWYSKSDGAAEDAAWSGSAIQFPRIQGIDVCGTIVALGEQVDATRLGDRVLIEPCLVEAGGKSLPQPWFLGSECDGGFAEYTVVASRHAHTIDSPLSDIELASFPCSYSTAENMLTRAGVTAEDTVLITGASGGVGSAAIQLARARGADVLGITTPAKAEKIRQLGARRTLSRNDDLARELGTNSIDVVIDLVAGDKWPELLEILKPYGRYAVAGAIAGPIVELDVRTLYLKDLTLIGCTVLGESVFASLVERIEAGQVSPLVSETFPLSRIHDAQKQFEAKKYIGKFVINVKEA